MLATISITGCGPSYDEALARLNQEKQLLSDLESERLQLIRRFETTVAAENAEHEELREAFTDNLRNKIRRAQRKEGAEREALLAAAEADHLENMESVEGLKGVIQKKIARLREEHAEALAMIDAKIDRQEQAVADADALKDSLSP